MIKKRLIWGGRTAALLLSILLVSACPSFSQLSWPAITSQTRPWTRWWWMGSAVDRRNLTANLEKYKMAGLGGLELTPIYGVKGYEDRFIDYLSPRWMDMLSFTLQETRRLGLQLDMTTGTGWPFGGGPLIDSVFACKELFYKTWTVRSGEQLLDTVSFTQETLIHTDGFPKPTIGQLVEPVFANKDRQALALDQVRFPIAIPLITLMAYSGAGEILDLTDKVDASGRLDWTAPPAGATSSAATSAAADWTLYAIFQGLHGKMVERAAPGAEGNVIDHFSAAALKKYLSRFDTAFAGHNLSGLRSFFNDSYEVDDARGQSNWTPGFFAIFRQRRGYDLRQHLPALFGKDTKDNNDRVLCDYRETISDLLLLQFTIPWRDWAHTKGALIRDQAHGSPANILDLYAASDIPETEGSEVLRYKFATSAAHVTGKRLASSESVTWLDEHFLSTLSDVKTALDKYLLGGVNHIFYHGTAYTPVNDPWPGWLFYASVHFTPNDPSWPNFSTLNNYVARCQSFLQQGAPDNDVLLYYPVYDSWSERGPALLKHFDRMEPEFNGTGFKDCAETMQRKGYAFDYISDRQLQQASFAGHIDHSGATVGGILTSTGGTFYKTVLLPDCHYISPETFKRLIQLAEKGAIILAYRSLPSGVPGFGDLSQRMSDFQQLLSLLHFAATDKAGIQKAVLGKGAILVGDDIDQLLAFAAIRHESMVNDSLSFVRRQYKNGSVYFISNHDNKEWKGYVALSTTFSSAAIFNPMTGLNGVAHSRASQHKVYLQLLPGETCLVETSNTVFQAPVYPYYHTIADPVTLRGKWTIQFEEGGPRLPAAATIDQLGSWTALDDPGAKAFSGTAKYTLAFARPAGRAAAARASGRKSTSYVSSGISAWMLDLGKVNETAQVFLNGKKISTLIGPDYRVIVPVSAIREKNTLAIRVSNRMVNRIEDMDRQGIPWKKFYNTNFPAHDRANRGPNGLFDASKWTPLDAGLTGPVTLTPLVTTTPRIVSAQPEDPAWTREVGSRSFPSSGVTISVNTHGAVKDGLTLSTKAIQSAIDACAAKGGGAVIFEPGSYLTGSIFLKEGVELRIDKGVELKGSQHFEDYPEIDTRIAGIEMKWPAALLNIIGVKKAAITGEGKVNAQGKFCWDKYWAMRKEYDPKGLRWIVDYDAKRVRTLLIQNASDVTIKNVRFVDAGFWTVQVLYSKYVTVDGIIVRNNEDGHGPSTDGVDIDSSSWVLVQNCDIDCNDDDFCLKAGRDWDGLRVDRPTEYVVIRKCIARKGGGLLTIGSETAGSIRHVLATDLTAKGTGNGFHIKSATTRGGTVEDIHIRNISMDSVGNAILFTMNWNPAYSYSTLPKGYDPDSIPPHWKTMLHKVEPPEKGIPHFKDIFVSGIKVASARKAISAAGLDRSMITGVHIGNMEIAAATAGEIDYAKDWDLKNVTISTKDGTKLLIKNSDNISYN